MDNNQILQLMDESKDGETNCCGAFHERKLTACIPMFPIPRLALPRNVSVVVPAVHGRVVRLFSDISSNDWYIANHHHVEVLPASSTDDTESLAHSFRTCLQRFYTRGIRHFVKELNPNLCWFFCLFPAVTQSTF